MAQPFLAKSAHFALHFLADRQLSSALSVDDGQPVDKSVDKSVDKPRNKMLTGPRIGLVVPKRWARRSVTRNLLKRQMRQVLAERHHRPLLRSSPVQMVEQGLASGMWVLRLRHAFDAARFPSAASDALRMAARQELINLVDQAVQRSARNPASAVREPAKPRMLTSASSADST